MVIRRQAIIWTNDELLLSWPLEQISVKFETKYGNFYSQKSNCMSPNLLIRYIINISFLAVYM